MLKLSKETLVELTADDLTSVVGAGDTCFAASCITGDPVVINITRLFTHVIATTVE